MRESSLDFVSSTFLPKIIATRAFQAVGFSRDGITERGGQPKWLALIAQARKAGLRVYMKPGDGELTALPERQQIEAWAKVNFDVRETSARTWCACPGRPCCTPGCAPT